MTEFTLQDHLQGSARFTFFRKNVMWYRTSHTNLLFPVPVEEVTCTLLVTEKATFFRRWITKHLSATDS